MAKLVGYSSSPALEDAGYVMYGSRIGRSQYGMQGLGSMQRQRPLPPEERGIFRGTYNGVPNPLVPFVHAYPTRYHGAIFTAPMPGYQYKQRYYAKAPFLGFGAIADWLGYGARPYKDVEAAPGKYYVPSPHPYQATLPGGLKVQEAYPGQYYRPHPVSGLGLTEIVQRYPLASIAAAGLLVAGVMWALQKGKK